MSFQMVRVFCATPSDAQSDLEAERHAFYDVVGEWNEAEGMPEGILFVPVSVLPSMASLIVYRQPVDENVRACTFYIQLLQHTWGPEPRNFEHHYKLATECCTAVSILFKAPDPFEVEPGVASLKESTDTDFKTLDEFKTRLRTQLSTWFQSIRTA
jgi:hypothetical protein